MLHRFFLFTALIVLPFNPVAAWQNDEAPNYDLETAQISADALMSVVSLLISPKRMRRGSAISWP